MGVPGRVLLGLEQGVKVPEAALHVVVGRHLGKAELKEDLPVFSPHLEATKGTYHKECAQFKCRSAEIIIIWVDVQSAQLLATTIVKPNSTENTNI
jgi:hypothetical protein